MAHFEFNIGPKVYRLSDVGADMNAQFIRFYESHYSGAAIDLSEFGTHAMTFFDMNDGNTPAHDHFFENFSILWHQYLSQYLYRDAVAILQSALTLTYEWEKANSGKRIHKGSPYYFLGVTYILAGDMESGFLLMHQALEEDKITQGTPRPNTPAYAFATLDYEKQDQFFREEVLDTAGFIDKALIEYNSTRSGALSLPDFKTKFLREQALEEEVFYFIFQAFHLKKLLVDIDRRLMQNALSSMMQVTTYFSLCLVIDNVIKWKNPSQWKFFDHLLFVSTRTELSFTQAKLLQVNADYRSDFSKTLEEMLGGTYSFPDGSKPTLTEQDLLVAYGFRNFGAHKIEALPIVFRNFDKIFYRLMNCLCYLIEKIY